MRRALVPVVLAVLTSGCLVVSLHPAYDDDSLTWDAALLGSWVDADDNASMTIDASEWRSYRISYVYPIETGTLTGYLTTVGEERFLDVMPVRGQDRGAFLVPVHIFIHVRLDGDRLELTPLSYAWFHDRVKTRTLIPGLDVVKDQRENALITSNTTRVRTWLRGRLPGDAMMGASAVFTRKP